MKTYFVVIKAVREGGFSDEELMPRGEVLTIAGIAAFNAAYPSVHLQTTKIEAPTLWDALFIAERITA